MICMNKNKNQNDAFSYKCGNYQLSLYQSVLHKCRPVPVRHRLLLRLCWIRSCLTGPPESYMFFGYCIPILIIVIRLFSQIIDISNMFSIQIDIIDIIYFSK